MKYTIELTDSEYNILTGFMNMINSEIQTYYFQNTELVPIKIRTTNLEDTEEYQIGYKMGLEDGAKAQNEEQYSKGSEDARQTLLNLLKIPSGEWGSIFDQDSYYVEAIFKHYSISEIAERIEAYEEKKKAEEVENYHILVDTLRTVTEEYSKEAIVSALSEFGFEVDKLRGEEE